MFELADKQNALRNNARICMYFSRFQAFSLQSWNGLVYIDISIKCKKKALENLI